MDDLDTPQAKLDTLAVFLAKLDKAAERLGLDSDRQIAAAFGMSKSNLSLFRDRARSGHGSDEVPEKWSKKLAKFEKAPLDRLDNLAAGKTPLRGLSQLQLSKTTYRFPRHVVAPLNPPASDGEATWDEVVGYCYALKSIGTPAEVVMSVLKQEFPIALSQKPHRDDSEEP